MSRLARLPTFFISLFSFSNFTSVFFFLHSCFWWYTYHYLIKSSYFPRSTSRQIVTEKSYLVLFWKNKGSKVTSFQSYKLYSLTILITIFNFLLEFQWHWQNLNISQLTVCSWYMWICLALGSQRTSRSLCFFSVNIRRTFF